MVRRILVLFDSPTLRDEAVHYSIELAKRTDSELVFLGLLPPESTDGESTQDGLRQSSTRARDVLMKHVEGAENAGIAAEGQLKLGDPQSELMKFLAGASSIRTIVWGGSRSVMESGGRRRNAHWLAKTKGILECPVVVPSMKAHITEKQGHRTLREEEKK
jgi:hypothetical protein